VVLAGFVRGFGWFWLVPCFSNYVLICQLWKWLLHLVRLSLKFSLQQLTFILELLLLEIDF